MEHSNLRTDLKLWVTGPSGAGKSHLTDLIRKRVEKVKPLTFDLDFVGFRRSDEDWTQWHINKAIFKLLAENGRAARQTVVAVGCDSDPDGMLKAATAAGFEPVVILPSLTELTARRRQRGDNREKILEASDSLESWRAHAERWNAAIVHSGQAVLSQWRI